MFKSRMRKLEERVEALEKKTAPSMGESISFKPSIIAEISKRKKFEELMKEAFNNEVSIVFPAELSCNEDFIDVIDYIGAIDRLKERKGHLS